MEGEIRQMQMEVAKVYDLAGLYQELLCAACRGVTNEQLLEAVECLNAPKAA